MITIKIKIITPIAIIVGCMLALSNSVSYAQTVGGGKALVSLSSTPKPPLEPIKSAFEDALKSKVHDDTTYSVIAKTIQAISASSPEMAAFFSNKSTIKQISEQILKSSWMNEYIEKGPAALLKASPTFLTDIVVDAAASVVKNNLPDKIQGQVIAWKIKGGYLATKSLIIAAGNPAAGAAEYISGGVQLNIEIWKEVLNVTADLGEAKSKAFRSEAYADLASQTNKAMQRYASASTAEEKQEILNLLKKSFDSIRQSSHPVASFFTTYPFQDAELNQMENLAISTVLDFDKAKDTRARELFSSGDNDAANKFLSQYFSHSEKDIFLIRLDADSSDLNKKRQETGSVIKASSGPVYKTKIGSEVSRSDDAGQPPSVQWATVTMQNQLSAITNGSASHIGSASLYAGVNNQPNASVNPNNTNNNQTQTGAQQAGYSTNTQAFQSSNWAMVAGNSATHMAEGNSFGSITAPNGGQLTSLNNSNKQYTLITKDFYVPVGVKQVTLTFNGNFVTNEYPT
ncbi:MAG: hypothetical protein WAW87_12020, partial [Candidatus Ferrigenium altingense]